MNKAYDADSVAALLVTDDGKYVLQRRDDAPHVDFPGLLGLFGGAIEPGETREAALTRELEEELSFIPRSVASFATLEFDERPVGGWCCRRTYFEVLVKPPEIAAMQLREGSGMSVLDTARISAMGAAVIPYDLCAMFMYARREVSRIALNRKRKLLRDVTE